MAESSAGDESAEHPAPMRARRWTLASTILLAATLALWASSYFYVYYDAFLGSNAGCRMLHVEGRWRVRCVWHSSAEELAARLRSPYDVAQGFVRYREFPEERLHLVPASAWLWTLTTYRSGEVRSGHFRLQFPIWATALALAVLPALHWRRRRRREPRAA